VPGAVRVPRAVGVLVRCISAVGRAGCSAGSLSVELVFPLSVELAAWLAVELVTKLAVELGRRAGISAVGRAGCSAGRELVFR